MKNRKIVVVAAMGIVAILLIGVIALSSNNPKTTPQVATAKITDFSVEWTPFPTVVGVTSVSKFNIIVENNGTVELAGLIMNIERIADDNKTNPDSYSFPNSGDYNFSLFLAQSKVIQVYIITDMVRTMQYRDSNQNFLATLTSNGPVLDSRKLY
jgi:hypothetical protein